MKFGEAGTKILDEMSRIGDWTFDETLIEKIEKENEALEQKMEGIKRQAESEEIDEALSINYMVLRNFRERNMRIIRSYKFKHLNKIQLACLNHTVEEITHGKYAEIERSIQELVSIRASEYGFLVFSQSDPPLNTYVQILTLIDCGVVMDGDSFIELKKNRIYYLKRQNIDHLIGSNGVRLLS